MVLYHLSIKCDLENIKQLVPIVNNLWTFDIASSDGSHTRESITINKQDEYELEGSKGTANFVIKFDKGAPASYIKLVDLKVKGKKGLDGTYSTENSGNFHPILALECRGCEITKWIPCTDFNALPSSQRGLPFEAIDLSELEWAEYDEVGDESVSIMGLEYKIEKM